MIKQFTRRALVVAGALVLATGFAVSQSGEPSEPRPGQRGKDVIWLPTHSELVNAMLNMAKLTRDDRLVDLGSGDGRTVIAAASRGVDSLGIEYDANLVAFSKKRAERAGVADKARFVRGDIFKTDFSRATVVTMFLLPELNMRLRPTLLDLKPGTRVVSNSFDMNGWQPDQTVEVDNGCTEYCRAFLWIVPAKVAGTWKLPDGELVLQQKFQFITGTLKRGDRVERITQGKITGNKVEFTAGGKRYFLTAGPEGLKGSETEMKPFTATRS